MLSTGGHRLNAEGHRSVRRYREHHLGQMWGTHGQVWGLSDDSVI